jgi:hypothetical protein
MGKRQKFSLEQIKGMLVSGLLFRDIHEITGWQMSELSLMCKCWGIPRQRGKHDRAKQQAPNVQ